MFRGIVFIASLYILAFSAVVSGSFILYENLEWRMNGHAALMMLQDPSRVPGNTGGYVYANVKYVEPNRETLVSAKYMPTSFAERMARETSIPIFFQPDNPRRVIYSKDELDTPWGWFVMGIALFFLARYAKKLLEAEAG